MGYPPDLEKAVDAWRASAPAAPTRPRAIRISARELLAKK